MCSKRSEAGRKDKLGSERGGTNIKGKVAWLGLREKAASSQVLYLYYKHVCMRECVCVQSVCLVLLYLRMPLFRKDL